MDKNQITARMFVTVHGEDIPWEALTCERKEEISMVLTDRVMQVVGYRRKKRTDREDELKMVSPEGEVRYRDRVK